MTFDDLATAVRPKPGSCLRAEWCNFDALVSDEGLMVGDFDDAIEYLPVHVTASNLTGKQVERLTKAMTKGGYKPSAKQDDGFVFDGWFQWAPKKKRKGKKCTTASSR